MILLWDDFQEGILSSIFIIRRMLNFNDGFEDIKLPTHLEHLKSQLRRVINMEGRKKSLFRNLIYNMLTHGFKRGSR